MCEKEGIPKTRRCLLSRGLLASAGQDDLLALYLSLKKGVREQKFVSTAEAAETAGLSQRTLQSWMDSGKIQGVRVGRKYRIYLNSLTEYLRRSDEK
jgi:excisionase family DNA binding protein